MKKFSWHTTNEKDRHGRYVGSEVFGKGGPFAFSKCYEHFKPNLKGGHTHNHLKNMELRLMLTRKEIKALRKIMKRKPTMDKRTFKICEAVHLGLEHYYMGKKDIRKVTDEDKKLASRIIPTLPDKWWLTKHSWDACRW